MLCMIIVFFIMWFFFLVLKMFFDKLHWIFFFFFFQFHFSACYQVIWLTKPAAPKIKGDQDHFPQTE